MVVSSDQLQQWGALATDDKLRNVVGFSLLRRSGSQTARIRRRKACRCVVRCEWRQPRVVLADGIPLDVPWGMDLWSRHSTQSSLDQVQLVPGGVSALYGNDAVGCD